MLIEIAAAIKKIAHRCPKDTEHNTKVVLEKLAVPDTVEVLNFFKENPEFGSNHLCEGCPWKLENAPDFLNCSLVVQEFGECSISEIAEMEGTQRHKIEELLNKSQLNFLKSIEEKGYNEIGKFYSKKWGVPYRGKLY